MRMKPRVKIPMTAPATARPESFFYRFWARTLSFLLALGFSLLLLIYPQALAIEGQHVAKGPLYALMFGISAGYVHGIGYVPRHPVLRIAFGPGVAWPLLFSGLVWLFLNP